MDQLIAQSGTEPGKGTLFDQELGLHRRIAQRDKSALLECFDLIGRFVYCHALLHTSSPAAAEDLTERLFVALWRQPDEFDPTQGPVALQLLRRMARSSAVS